MIAVPTTMHRSLSSLVLLVVMSRVCFAAGAGFEEPPEPDELIAVTAEESEAPRGAPDMALSVGPMLVWPGGDARGFARASLGVCGWWARWLSPRVAVVVTAERVSLATRPIVPATASIGWYALGAGLRASSSRTRPVHVFAQTEVAQHAMQIANDGWTRTAVAARLRGTVGVSVRLAADVGLTVAAAHDQVQTSLGGGRAIRVQSQSLQVAIGWRRE